MDTIGKKVKEIFADTFEIQESEVHNESSSNNIDNWDSLSHISLILGIENEFNIKFKMEEVLKLSSFKIIVQAIKGKIK